MGLNPKHNLQGLSPSYIRNKPDPTDLDGNLVTASVSCESSTYGNDPADSRQLSPLASDYENGEKPPRGLRVSVSEGHSGLNYRLVEERRAGVVIEGGESRSEWVTSKIVLNEVVDVDDGGGFEDLGAGHQYKTNGISE
ncbi:hypothetical protein F0562_013234 [Nyssa sinensis]|uniref:Uncharacterized protein n=1 Tax=Nyssa sinensis TaxID=561372 RepID=A0A5J4ZUJ8_9ASTE|nr:hypothetical protein F0562_013234 [Nyssa sinensis]